MQIKAFMLALLPQSFQIWQEGHDKHVNIASLHGIEARLVFVTMPRPPQTSSYVYHSPTSASINCKLCHQHDPLAHQNSSPIPDQGPTGCDAKFSGATGKQEQAELACSADKTLCPYFCASCSALSSASLTTRS